jgi:predicted amidophosphoribosyltransferase
MDQRQLTCPDCRAPYAAEDNYCRQCGMYLAALRETTAVAAAPRYALERQRAQLPAPVRRAVTAVAIGAALQVGVSLAGRYLAAQAAKSAVNAAVRSPKPARLSRSRQVPARTEDAAASPLDDAAAVSETLIYRRIWIRRP